MTAVLDHDRTESGRSLSDYVPIGSYAVIGDCRSAALISDRGSLDWLCWPRFDSGALFGAILDARRGGRFSIAPVGRFTSDRRYVGHTNVLETRFRASSGRLTVRDLMPVASEQDRGRELEPEHQLLRVVECVEGEVEVEVRYEPRPDFGRAPVRLVDRGVLGLWFEHATGVGILRSEIPLATRGDAAFGRATLRAGDRRRCALAFGRIEPLVLPALGSDAERRMERTLEWWEQWAGTCRYQGPWREAVLRSALTLKLLTYSPSGAIVAAPTTSLPESIGSDRNWDYRYCWLRDASLTVEVLFELGYDLESLSFLRWTLDATRMTHPELQVLYDVYGETRVPEREIPELDGYRGSRPVRIGNAARDQLQLDVYGEVIEAAASAFARGYAPDRETASLLVRLGVTVCERWREPDHGIWEMRGRPAHFTSSKAMAWVALDALLRLAEPGRIDVPIDRFTAAARAIRDRIEATGYNARLSSYTSVLGGEEPDASLLLLALHGYADPMDPRMRSTAAWIREHLGTRGLIRRYRPGADALPGVEGAFGICGFWSAEVRALEGDLEGATNDFERVLSYANDVGLFAEEIDSRSGEQLGNFPQAYTHVGLIHAAITLAAAAERRDGRLGRDGEAAEPSHSLIRALPRFARAIPLGPPGPATEAS